MARVSPRAIFAILIAFAMLFAPVAMPTGAMAMAPAGEHAQMMASGHCGEKSADKQDSKSPAKSCCVAMCAAVALSPAPPMAPRVFARVANRASIAQFIHGYFTELATPPPRRA